MKGLINKFKTPLGKIIISTIWGLGLATMFQRVCKGSNCIVFKAPKNTDINDKIFLYNNKCYRYTPESSECNDNPIKIMD
jgi:hypothetical protein